MKILILIISIYFLMLSNMWAAEYTLKKNYPQPKYRIEIRPQPKRVTPRRSPREQMTRQWYPEAHTSTLPNANYPCYDSLTGKERPCR